MRDVTDNRTGELEGLEVRRGRGRPRKEGALSNAQRQAAYRARRRANVVAEYGVTGAGVTKESAPVDADADLRAELAQARKDVEIWQGIADDLRRQLCQAEMERDAVIGWGVSRDEGKLQAALKARRASIKKAALAESAAPAKAVTSKRVTEKAPAAKWADSDWPFPSGN